MNNLRSIKAAAIELGVSVSLLNKWRREGDGPPFVALGRRVVYDPNDLAAFVEAHRQKPGNAVAA